MKGRKIVFLFRLCLFPAFISSVIAVISVNVGTQGFTVTNTPLGVLWFLISGATWLITTTLSFVFFVLWIATEHKKPLLPHPVRGGLYYWVAFSLLIWFIIFLHSSLYLEKNNLQPQTIEAPTVSPIPSETTTPTPTNAISTPSQANNTVNSSLPCGDRYATASEIHEALNSYRRAHGAGNLAWNDKLAEVARMRVAQTLSGGRDSHQGFIEFTNNQENFYKVGFAELSENIGSSGDCPLLGVHLIEQKVAKSAAHDAAQRDPSWIAVGIATDRGITSFIFGKDPL